MFASEECAASILKVVGTGVLLRPQEGSWTFLWMNGTYSTCLDGTNSHCCQNSESQRIWRYS